MRDIFGHARVLERLVKNPISLDEIGKCIFEEGISLCALSIFTYCVRHFILTPIGMLSCLQGWSIQIQHRQEASIDFDESGAGNYFFNK
jgi:hypothetical protein